MAEHEAVIVGCGGRSDPHIRAYEHLEQAGVVACCDIQSEKRDEIAGEFGIRAYADAAEMINQEAPDIVHIVTTPNVRVEVMRLVSEMKVPLCIVEKPIATGVGDWKALCELEKTSGTKFAVCHQFRWQPHLVKCREALASGRLGDLEFLDFSAGMNVSGQGTHILNYGMSFNGDSPVVRVFGAASGVSETDPAHPAPDTTVGYLTFENEVRALWNNGPTAPTCGDPDIFWQHVRIAAYADKGRVNYEEFGQWEIVSPVGVERGHFGGMDTWVENNLLAQAGLYQAMFDWLDDDQKMPGTHLSQSLHEWKVVLALYASALYRTPIKMSEFAPPEDLFEQLKVALRR
ncbi:MAG: Gfo/Idh/MocA family oxidoreductase [Candidatus Thorarchaeota archaeon]